MHAEERIASIETKGNWRRKSKRAERVERREKIAPTKTKKKKKTKKKYHKMSCKLFLSVA